MPNRTLPYPYGIYATPTREELEDDNRVHHIIIECCRYCKAVESFENKIKINGLGCSNCHYYYENNTAANVEAV